ncbi:hypothetical protein ACFQGX_01935 [Nonomuraea dietziae]|uniref:hypothetical protein n=1 Tax=Nonomuraea dietziae TaxID=65515 RepID=UPI00361F26ED
MSRTSRARHPAKASATSSAVVSSGLPMVAATAATRERSSATWESSAYHTPSGKRLRAPWATLVATLLLPTLLAPSR